MASQRLIESFKELAAGMRFSAVKRPLDGLYEVEGCRVADVDKVTIQAVQVPSKTVPDSVFTLIRNTRCAVLVFKSSD